MIASGIIYIGSYVTNAEDETLKNTDLRRALYMGKEVTFLAAEQ
jgi:hypothetical protein